MLKTALLMAMLTTPSDGIDEVSLALTQPLQITLDPATYDEESDVVRSEPIVMPDGLVLQVHVGTRRLGALDLYSQPIVLFFDQAHAWEGNTLEQFEVLHPTAEDLAAHLRRPDMDVMCGDRHLQTYVESSLGGPIAIGVGLSGGLFGVSPTPDNPCPIEIIEWGDDSWTTKCEPRSCSLGNGATGTCGPTALSQCACSRPPNTEAPPPEDPPSEDPYDPGDPDDWWYRWWLEQPWFPFDPWFG